MKVQRFAMLELNAIINMLAVETLDGWLTNPQNV